MLEHQVKTVEIYNQFADQYLEKFLTFDLYNDTFQQFVDLLPDDSSLLELGCGPGNVIKYLNGLRPDFTFTGIDLAPEMIRKAKELNPEAIFEVNNFLNYKTSTQPYEAVVAAFCLPYISLEDLPIFFENLSLVTRKNGYVYISCMEGLPQKSGFEKTSFTGDQEIFMYYHQKETLEYYFKKNGLLIINTFEKNYPEVDGSFTVDLIYIAKKM